MSTAMSNIVKKEKLREAQLDTLEKIASVVGETAGPAGSYVMILNEASNNVFTKDGHKVLSNIKFLQPLERSIMEEVNSSTGYIVKTVGDGTTAMTKMAYQVFARLCEYEEQHPEIPRHTIINSFKEARSTGKTIKLQKFFEALNKYFDIEINTIFNNDSSLGTLVLFKDITQHIKDVQTIEQNQEILIEKERLATLRTNDWSELLIT